MYKLFGILFALNAFLILVELALGMPVHFWQLLITGAMAAMWKRGRTEAAKREERLGNAYSHYDPKTYKAPTRYHEM